MTGVCMSEITSEDHIRPYRQDLVSSHLRSDLACKRHLRQARQREREREAAGTRKAGMQRSASMSSSPRIAGSITYAYANIRGSLRTMHPQKRTHTDLADLAGCFPRASSLPHSDRATPDSTTAKPEPKPTGPLSGPRARDEATATSRDPRKRIWANLCPTDPCLVHGLARSWIMHLLSTPYRS